MLNGGSTRSLTGPGQTYVAEGVYNWHGGATCSYAINTAFFGAGGSMWNGAGQVIQNGIPMISTAVTASASGAGMGNFVGGGSMTIMYVPQFSAQVARFNAGVATDFFVGMGW